MSTVEDIVKALDNIVGGAEDGELSQRLKAGSADNTWMLIAGALVFFMHAGFTMLEAGSVRHTSAVNILFKNMGTISIGALAWFFFGWSFAYGTGNDDSEPTEGFTMMKFIGTGSYAFADQGISAYALIFFQMMFCATAATIVSGAVAGRISLAGYFAIATWLTAFVYPVVAHVGWATGGWLSAFNSGCVAAEVDSPYCFYYKEADGGTGVKDFAGSSIVHMTGGVAAFWCALVLGPRLGRFAEGGAAKYAPHNVGMQALGTFILWFGWYGFNCGSTLVMDGVTAGGVAVTTTLAPAASVVTGIIVTKLFTKSWDIGSIMNGALAGLVSITAPCGNVSDNSAIAIGAIGFLVYYGSSKLLKLIKIDDPVDAIAVHGFAGAWGTIAAGIFNIGGTTGVIMETQLIMIVFVIGWVTVTTLPFVIGLKVAGVLRVSAEDEESGIDASEHDGAKAYNDFDM